MLPLKNPFLHDKERDNTWLQLPVCPQHYNAITSGAPSCPNSDEKCAYAHPSESLKDRILSNRYIVSCHDFVFSHSGRRGCHRKDCKYFHPPEHLRLLVINAGKNNKRLRSEIKTRQQLSSGLVPAVQTHLPFQPQYQQLFYQPQPAALLDFYIQQQAQQQQQTPPAVPTSFLPAHFQSQPNLLNAFTNQSAPSMLFNHSIYGLMGQAPSSVAPSWLQQVPFQVNSSPHIQRNAQIKRTGNNSKNAMEPDPPGMSTEVGARKRSFSSRSESQECSMNSKILKSVSSQDIEPFHHENEEYTTSI